MKTSPTSALCGKSPLRQEMTRGCVPARMAGAIWKETSDALVEITLFFTDREPVGPYKLTVGARRTLHLRFNELSNPEPIPPGRDYASVFESDQPIVVQHTRLDSRAAEIALLSTIAWPAD